MPNQRPSLRELLRLMSIPKIGPGRIQRLFSAFGSAKTILNASANRLQKISGIDEKLARQIKSGVDERLVEQQLDLLATHKIHHTTLWEADYPDLLKKISDPPVVLFYRGALPDVTDTCLGIVGTRMPTQYGRHITEQIARQLTEKGISVISGMARGIDTTAHQAALNSGGKTHAILGCGVDYVYPTENRPLYHHLIKSGSVISEYFIGTRPEAPYFPRRNRIISGMSRGVLVVEAGKKSGALITANYALEQNREVFAIPGNINNPKCIGSNRLIQQGAKLVQSVEDIIEELSSHFKPLVTQPDLFLPDLNEQDKILLDYLSAEPLHIDQLVLQLQESPAVLLSRLLNLELQGLVKQLSGKMFIRV